jgi:hypothetical protein
MTKSIHIALFALLLWGLRTRSLFPVTVLTLLFDSLLPLALDSAAVVQRPRLTVDAVMHIRYPLVWVVTDDVLPRLAPFAEYRTAIIFVELTNALDGVRLFFVGGD